MKFIHIVIILLIIIAGIVAYVFWLAPATGSDEVFALTGNSLVAIDAPIATPKASSQTHDVNTDRVQASPTPTGLQTIATGRYKYITKGSSPETVLAYSPDTGNIVALSFNHHALTTVATVPPRAKDISWSFDRSMVMAHYDDGAQWFDLESGKSKTFEPAIKHPVFAPDQHTVLYTYFNEATGQGNISIADPQIEGFKNILPTRFDDWDIQWLEDSTVALTRGANELAHGTLALLDTRTAKLSTLIQVARGLETQWSVDHASLLYSEINPRTQDLELWYRHIGSGQEAKLPIATRASKCTWATDGLTIYCAVPDIDVTAQTLYQTTQDSIMALDLNEFGSVIDIRTVIPATSLHVSELLYSSLYHTLILTDTHGMGIYSITLPDA